MNFIRYFCLIALLSSKAMAQAPGDDCASALNLCPNNSVHYNNIGATTQICSGCPDGSTASGVFCEETNNSVWYTFTTNTSGGSASLSFSNISCLTGGGRDNEIEVTVLQVGTACTPSTYGVIACGGPFSSNQIVNLAGLNPSTTYYVVVDGNDVGSGITAPAECDFDIELSGAAVQPEFTTVITNASCAGNDGEINVTAVTGATAPLSYSIDGGSFQSSSIFTNLSQGPHTIIVQSSGACSYTTNVEVPLNGGPQDGTVNVVASSCGLSDGEISITGITGGVAPYSYSLDAGAPQVSNTFTGLNGGNYNVTVTDDNGCTFIYENISVPVTGAISTAVVNVIQPTCNNPTGTISITPIGGTAPFSYSLNGGPPQASNVFSGLAPGNYIILIFDGGGCIYSDSQIILEPFEQNETAQVLVSPSNVSICDGESVTFNAFYSNGGSSPTLQWQVNGVNAGTGNSTFVPTSLNNGDVVTCILTSNDPCVSTTIVTSNQVNVIVTPQVNPVVVTTSSVPDACAGETVVFTSTATGCTDDGTYYWYVNGALVDSTSGSTLSQTLMGDAEVTSSFMCNSACSNLANSPSVNVSVTEVFADAGPNQLIGQGESTVLLGDGNGTFSWTPSGSLDDASAQQPVATPESTTTYLLTVTEGDCAATDEVTVVVTELIIVTNTVTPNEDGVNDVWIIDRIEKYPSCKVTIYDRWGQKVYNSTGYSNDNPWDAKYLGKYLPAAAYYYVIELNAATSKEADTYYGWVAVIY